MAQEITIPVIAGLAVGIGLIMLFAALFMSPALPHPLGINNNNPHFSLAIEGLKSAYKIGEKIDPIIRIQGFGNPCFSPNLAVRNTKTLEVVWASRTALDTCEMQKPQVIDVNLHPVDFGGASSPIVINETGTYEIAASIGQGIVLKTFDVVS